MGKFTKIFITAYWAFFIFYLLTYPFPPSQEYGVSYGDKVVHFFIFGALAYLLFGILEMTGITLSLNLLLGLVLASGYGAVLEYYQQFIPGRTASFYDSLAGTLGALAAAAVVYYLERRKRPRLLLHVCCIACGAYVTELLKKDFRPILFFYNPNIYPEAEYFRRLAETKRVARSLGVKVLAGEYSHPRWRELIRGHEDDPERGERCLLCYGERLKAAACLAKAKKIPWFASTLSISPHKSAEEINRLGRGAAAEYGLKFLEEDFKKQDGFKKSLELSKGLKLYRQDYCGCEFSMRKS